MDEIKYTQSFRNLPSFLACVDEMSAFVDEEHFMPRPRPPETTIVAVGRIRAHRVAKPLGFLCCHLDRPRRAIKAYSAYCAASIALFESKVFGRYTPMKVPNVRVFPGAKIDITGTLRRVLPVFIEKFDSGRAPDTIREWHDPDAASELRLVLHLLAFAAQNGAAVRETDNPTNK